MSGYGNKDREEVRESEVSALSPPDWLQGRLILLAKPSLQNVDRKKAFNVLMDAQTGHNICHQSGGGSTMYQSEYSKKV